MPDTILYGIRDGQEWGPWRLSLDTCTLDYQSRLESDDPQSERIEPYDIPLSDMVTAAAFLRWFGQIAEKSWPPEDVGYLVQALDELFHFGVIGNAAKPYGTTGRDIRKMLRERARYSATDDG